MGENDNDDENENEKRDRDRARSRRVSCAGGWLVPLFREAARLVAEIPRAQLQVLPGTGHFLVDDEPEPVPPGDCGICGNRLPSHGVCRKSGRCREGARGLAGGAR